MQPTKTYGICGDCGDPNPYTRTKCLRCGARLVWAFLIDGKKDPDFDPPIVKFFSRLFGTSAASRKRHARCRFCKEPVVVDEKVCPHCLGWLVGRTPFGKNSGPIVDAHAPEIQRLLKLRGIGK
jgi:predicted amidophosphoribosyltransferase